MSEYNPDKFVILEYSLETTKKYRLFGTWAGSYASGDSWRANSGIERAVRDSGTISFIGASGSVYKCNISSEGVTGASGIGILNDALLNDHIRVVDLQECIDNEYFPIEVEED